MTNRVPVSKLRLVGQKRQVPQEWRNSVAEHLEAWIRKQPQVRGKTPSERALAKKLGVSSFTVNKLRHREGPLGLDVLVRLRDPLGLTLDQLLGLEPNIEALRRILREELEAQEQRRVGKRSGTG